MRGAEAWACGAVQTRGVGGRQRGGKELAAGQSLVGIHQPRGGTLASAGASGDADGVCVVG